MSETILAALIGAIAVIVAALVQLLRRGGVLASPLDTGAANYPPSGIPRGDTPCPPEPSAELDRSTKGAVRANGSDDRKVATATTLPLSTSLTEILAGREPGELSLILDTSEIQVSLTTEVGQRVRDFLDKGRWFADRPRLHIVKKTVRKGNRCELAGVYELPNRIERVVLLFFWERGAIRFHDVFYGEVNGVPINKFVSALIEEVRSAARGNKDVILLGNIAMSAIKELLRSG